MKDLQSRLDQKGLEVVIWCETHIELNTKSKMFCSCSNTDTKEPNTNICPICTGQMWTLPNPNKEAILKTMKLWLSLWSEITKIIDRDRKHYEYPDLPKWFQLTQLDNPIVDWWEVKCFRSDWSTFEVELDHVHLEEDAGKLVHKDKNSFVDFNRAWRALIEIVTTPSIHKIDDTTIYLEYLQKIVRSIWISDADMEKWHLRSDISISLRKKWDTMLNPRTEIKNLNSFKFSKNAILKEVETQLEQREKLDWPKQDQVTVLWDETTKSIKVMRTKENANDYRFIKEPDIPQIDISWAIWDISVNYEMLPYQIEEKLISVWIRPQDTKKFSWDIEKAFKLFAVWDWVWDLKLTYKLFTNYISDQDYKNIDVDLFIDLIGFIQKESISWAKTKHIIKEVLKNKDYDYLSYISSVSISEKDILEKINSVLKYPEAQKILEDIKKTWEQKRANSILGIIMRELKDVDGKLVKKILRDTLWYQKIEKSESLESESKKTETKRDFKIEDIEIHQKYRDLELWQIDESLISKEILVSWWIQSIRDHGELVFIDLRQWWDYLQLRFSRDEFKDLEQITDLKKESVIMTRWKIVERSKDDINKNIKTWILELAVKDIKVLSTSKDLPFEIRESKKVNETQRFKNRFLDIRNDKVRKNIILRSEITNDIRTFFQKKWFTDVETPLLTKWSDEWSREFVVPSRIHPGQYYVLPQAPQQVKQILIASWIDKYYQIARCFRDEDDRWDRQPEFTQVDMEMAFVSQEDVISIISELIEELLEKHYSNKKLLWWKIHRLTYQEAMDKYWSDKPDIRFWLEMQDITDLLKDTDFKVFRKPINQWGIVKSIKVEKPLTRNNIDYLTKLAIKHWLGGLAYIMIKEDWLHSPIIKYLWEDVTSKIVDKMWGQLWDTIFFSASDFDTTNKALDKVRREIGKMQKLYSDNDLWLCWIVDFPMFEKTEDDKWKFTHNPFSMPQKEYINDLYKQKNIDKIKAQQYDIVLNGSEIWWWSIRAHIPEILESTYKVMWYSKEETQKSVWHMLDIFKYWVPPHGWIALGLDRLLMVLENEKSIREVIPFPKTWSGQDLLFNAPSTLPESKLKELGI